jgi:hypothetical protein
MASPGNSAKHQAVVTSLRPSSSMAPQLEVGGGTPKPRKLRDASATMTRATEAEWSCRTSTVCGFRLFNNRGMAGPPAQGRPSHANK